MFTVSAYLPNMTPPENRFSSAAVAKNMRAMALYRLASDYGNDFLTYFNSILVLFDIDKQYC